MSDTFERVKALIANNEIRISDHGYDELADDEIAVVEVLAGVEDATVVEDYPEFAKGPCVLVLEFDAGSKPIHVVWGIPLGHAGPAVLVTAYRPDPARWSEDFLERLK